MVNSMTGFGRGESVGRLYRFTVEIRSLNHRFADVHIRLPREFSGWETRVRKAVLKVVRRGRVDLSLLAEPLQGTHRLTVNRELALAYYEALADLARTVGTDEPVPVAALVHLPDVFRLENTVATPAELWPELAPALDQALAQLADTRRREGAVLAAEVQQRLATLDKLLAQVRQEVPLVTANYRKRLLARLQEWLPDDAIDSDRLTAEVVLMAERSTITEEITRLGSHLTQMRESLTAPTVVGRKLEFLLQEAQREVQTIGAKAQSTATAQAVVGMKGELESLREQAQNIE